MITKKILHLSFFFLFTFGFLSATPLAQQWEEVGYKEILNNTQGEERFNYLYLLFDNFIEFLQNNPEWARKLYIAKERFIRSKDKNHYSTDSFGLYDESEIEQKRQIAFYYSSRFHDFIYFHYREFHEVSEIINFFAACREIERSNQEIFNEAANELSLGMRLYSAGTPPVILKIVKYLPSYMAIKPHYDGTAFTLFLDSTDNQALLISPYKSQFQIEDFVSPTREFARTENQNSTLLIPGALLGEFSIYPTPHIVLGSGNTRYATIAFAMRPNYSGERIEFAPLPSFENNN